MTNTSYPATGQTAPAAQGTLLIKNVRPYGESDPVNVLVEDGVIKDLNAAADATADRDLDGKGGVLLPGLVDLHVHLREPGNEAAEDIASGSAAAARGGFTAVFAMANNDPVTDSPATAENMWNRGQAVGLCDVHPVGSITQGLEGKKLTEMGLMARSGAKVRMFSDDGKCVNDPQVMRRAIEYARGTDVLLAQHAEDHRLTEGATAHEGTTAGRLGLRGWPRTAEESVIARDIMLARDYRGRVHFCHVSSEGSLELIRSAKDKDIPVTAEVTPHHLLLDDEVLNTYSALYRVNPPLREKSDVEKLRAALLDGTIDVVATDHAPHTDADKACEFELARPGMLGLETSLAIIAKLFVETGDADWRWVARVMSERPAEIARIPDHGRPIAVGEPANLTVVNDNEDWEVNADELASKARNTPYAGRRFGARVAATVLRGNVTHNT